MNALQLHQVTSATIAKAKTGKDGAKAQVIPAK